MAIGVGGDYDDITIQDRWWSLMSYALKEKSLCVRLEKHLDSGGREVLLVEVYPTDKNPEGKRYRAYNSSYEVRLYFEIKKYVDEYNP